MAVTPQHLTTDGVHDLGNGVKVRVWGGGASNGGSTIFSLAQNGEETAEVGLYDGGAACGGDECWTVDGAAHRVDGPAIQRDGGIVNGGSEHWFLDGGRHRVDGPAVQLGGGISRGGDEWWAVNGRTHRDDGPAITQFTGGEFELCSWYDNGVQLASTTDWGPVIMSDEDEDGVRRPEWCVDGEWRDLSYEPERGGNG